MSVRKSNKVMLCSRSDFFLYCSYSSNSLSSDSYLKFTRRIKMLTWDQLPLLPELFLLEYKRVFSQHGVMLFSGGCLLNYREIRECWSLRTVGQTKRGSSQKRKKKKKDFSALSEKKTVPLKYSLKGNSSGLPEKCHSFCTFFYEFVCATKINTLKTLQKYI